MTELQKKTAQAIVNIFETGRARGRYGETTVLAGDSGHLSYGRSQATLGSGSLYLLLKNYCEATGARYSAQISPLLERFRRHPPDLSLDYDREVRELLHAAGDDPVMQRTQDEFFDRGYWEPALRSAQACALTLPLSFAVVYDSKVHGGFDTVRRRMTGGSAVSPPVKETDWVAAYVAERKAWLEGCADPLPRTTYRMKAFGELIGQNKWNLELPMVVHGVALNKESLEAEPDPVVASRSPETAYPVLQLTRPYTRGEKVRELQNALKRNGFGGEVDDVFGPLTEVLVKQFQRKHGLCADGVVGPLTWVELARDAAGAARV
jgi:chitosanase